MALEGIFNTPTQVFDLYYLFVEVVFGSVLLSAFGILIILIIIGFLTKQSLMLIFYISLLFLVTMGVGYAGALVAIPIFLLAFLYFTINLVKFVNSLR